HEVTRTKPVEVVEQRKLPVDRSMGVHDPFGTAGRPARVRDDSDVVWAAWHHARTTTTFADFEPEPVARLRDLENPGIEFEAIDDRAKPRSERWITHNDARLAIGEDRAPLLVTQQRVHIDDDTAGGQRAVPGGDVLRPAPSNDREP